MNRRGFLTLAGVSPALVLPAVHAAKPEIGGQLRALLEAANIGPPPVLAPITTQGLRMSCQWQVWFNRMYSALREGVPKDTPYENGWRNK